MQILKFVLFIFSSRLGPEAWAEGLSRGLEPGAWAEGFAEGLGPGAFAEGFAGGLAEGFRRGLRRWLGRGFASDIKSLHLQRQK